MYTYSPSRQSNPPPAPPFPVPSPPAPPPKKPVNKVSQKQLYQYLQRADSARYVACIAILFGAAALGLAIYSTVASVSNTARLNNDSDDESSESSPIKLQSKRDDHIVYGSAITEGGKVSGRMMTGGVVNILSGKEVRLESAKNILKDLPLSAKDNDVFPFHFVNRQSETDVSILISEESGVVNSCDGTISRGSSVSVVLQIQSIEKGTVVLYC